MIWKLAVPAAFLAGWMGHVLMAYWADKSDNRRLRFLKTWKKTRYHFDPEQHRRDVEEIIGIVKRVTCRIAQERGLDPPPWCGKDTT